MNILKGEQMKNIRILMSLAFLSIHFLAQSPAELQAQDYRVWAPAPQAATQFYESTPFYIQMSDEELLLDSISKGDTKKALNILNKGIDLTKAVDVKGNTALHFALVYKNMELAELLITKYGQKINSKNEDGMTPLALYLRRSIRPTGKIDVQGVHRLLELGADVNSVSKTELTPLLVSILSGEDDPKIIKALLDAGADVNKATETMDCTPLFFHLYLSKESENPQLFERKDADSSITKMLIDAGADVNYNKGKKKISILHKLSLRYENLKNFELLLSAGLDIDIPNKNGTTPLTYAADNENGDINMVKRLLELGADPEAKNSLTGKTALDYAIARNNQEMVDLLKAAINSPKKTKVLLSNAVIKPENTIPARYSSCRDHYSRPVCDRGFATLAGRLNLEFEEIVAEYELKMQENKFLQQENKCTDECT